MHTTQSIRQVRELVPSSPSTASPSMLHNRHMQTASVATIEAPTFADYAAVLHQVLPQKSRVQEPVIYKPTGPRLPLRHPEKDGDDMGDRPSSVRGQRLAKKRVPAHVPHSGVSDIAQSVSKEQELQCCKVIQAANALEELITRHPTLRRNPGLQQQYQQRQQEAASAVQLLLKSCRKLITYQAHRLQYSLDSNRRVPYDDMFTAGVLGMLEAARKFRIESEPTSVHQPVSAAGRVAMQGTAGVDNDVRFSSFAYSYIAKHMRQAMTNYNLNDIYIPRPLMDIRTKAARTIRELKGQAAAAGQTAPTPTITHVAERMGTRTQVVADLVQAMALTTTAYDEGDDEDEGDLKAVWRIQPAVDNQNDTQQSKDHLSKVLKPNEVEVLLKSVGLSVTQDGNTTGPMTQKQIATEMGVSRQYVDQLQKSAVRKLQQACEGNAGLKQNLQELCDLM